MLLDGSNQTDILLKNNGGVDSERENLSNVHCYNPFGFDFVQCRPQIEFSKRQHYKSM